MMKKKFSEKALKVMTTFRDDKSKRLPTGQKLSGKYQSEGVALMIEYEMRSGQDGMVSMRDLCVRSCLSRI